MAIVLKLIVNVILKFYLEFIINPMQFIGNCRQCTIRC